ncbi:tRNA-splicing endonuclease subunit sen54 N-term-domain-containing protein [Desarmillaria tabescens]|uniref:tRNA-splicing endonuclease subunit sen54 N-term-domain-containing protein n=1 Tax=Armillaria tabescens TaxID=1929756 RepID=A0AA39KAT5_ARMTA|nr:tRNA-splicing endonuclease subunit sen54 N-term-domain-containing protein [Desarmillaria tabescens]KAK0455383.1 tRNA-splicing endonuclease subunit sen54 N-term-domain-containing protein [Desarmillaria tabescens]
MDDILEQPSSEAPPPKLDDNPDEQSSGDEDEGPDWTKLKIGISRPVIPKRGEKEHEPAAGGESGLQQHILQRSRNAMFEALRATRTISSKTVSYGIWHPSLARVSVPVARGTHFSSMGHSASRLAKDKEKPTKRLELLPEEAIYLIERGSLFCWKEIDIDLSGLEDVSGAPMSVQQVYAEMIGMEDVTVEKYQVYSYLRRLGYVVTRTVPPTSEYPAAAPFEKMCPLGQPRPSIFERIRLTFFTWILKFFTSAFNWWRPLRLSRWFYHDKNYGHVFRSLRFMPAGHQLPLRQSKEEDSPYKPFYNLYKPPTPFKKTSPPPPDFQIVVINTRTTPMPSLRELTDLFDISPELPIPLPKRPPPPRPALPPLPWWRAIFPFQRRDPGPPARRPHPFVALRAGKKTVVIAAVDSGNISFFRFMQGAFMDVPMA